MRCGHFYRASRAAMRLDINMQRRAAITSTILICGVDDSEVGSPGLLAAQLPNAEVVLVPGDHFTANARPELHEALVAFLGRVSS